ncbi:MAG: heat-inducible transcriptional repressor HrcA [Halieaceae bacterium]|jgi:heat-inducible transcriptional repressor|nr:heat-inducible transcriptional repressor HrcA [Halieaceae bacterium]
MTVDELPPRASALLKTLVQMHIRDGQPVGSKSLHSESGLTVSPATIRNIMSDLEERGFLASPHTSAGRIPTAQGYRFFVDALLQVQPLAGQAIQSLREELNPNRPASELVQAASNILARVTSQAGIVTVPKPSAIQLRQIEFLPLADNRVLVILVVNEREVQNRIIEIPRPMSERELRAAADLLNQRYAGRDLAELKTRLVEEMAEARSRIDHYMASALELASSALADDDERDDPYVVAGEGHLLEQTAAEDIDKLRELFDAFERKRDLLDLLERCSRADGVQIFIGEEAGYEVFGDFSVITAPYGRGTQPLGVLGVIGPTRMAYERVIPMVDVTARMLSAALSH